MPRCIAHHMIFTVTVVTSPWLHLTLYRSNLVFRWCVLAKWTNEVQCFRKHWKLENPTSWEARYTTGCAVSTPVCQSLCTSVFACSNIHNFVCIKVLLMRALLQNNNIIVSVSGRSVVDCLLCLTYPLSVACSQHSTDTQSDDAGGTDTSPSAGAAKRMKP